MLHVHACGYGIVVREILKFIPILVLLFFSSSISFAQTLEDKKERADDLFESQQYEAAAKIYTEVLAQKPRDYEVNFRYGACLIYTSHNKEEAIKYLAYSVKSPSIDKRAYYFLGRAYHLNYQFHEAEKYYEKFKQQASTRQLKDYNVEAQLNACRYGRKLLADVTDMIVMEKKEINEKSFYDLYDMSDIGGTILVTDEFGTKEDKKREHRAVIHFPKDSPNIFYSSYGDDGETGLDIYQKKKLPNGKYSLSQKVRGQVNTSNDEDYAYMDPNGEYLYFCSKGHNSMGGYDVFRSKYDPKRDAFGPPENMDFAISSPDDDLLYVVDSKGSRAFFASKRESKAGNIFVYEVRVERIPMKIAAIKGQFVNEIVSSNKDMSIEVEDFHSGREIGTFNSKSSGEYFMTFPKGGKYKFYISVKGSDVTHYAVVEVPKLKELRPLKQRITLLRDESGEQIVEIENLFDEDFDDPVTVMAEIYRELAELEPNAEEFDLDSLEEMKDMDKIFVENGLDAFSTKDDVVYALEEEVENLEEELEKNESMANVSYNLGAEKSKEANEKMVEVNELIKQAENTTDEGEQRSLYKKANELNREVKKLNREAKEMIELGQKIDQEVEKNRQHVKESEKVLEDVKNVPEDDRVTLANTVKENGDFFKETVKDREVRLTVTEQIMKDANDEVRALNEVNSDITDLNNQKKQLEKDIEILESQLENTKRRKDREALEDEILDKKSDLNIVDNQLDQKTKQYDKMLDERQSNLSDAADIVSDEKYTNSELAESLTDEQKSSIANDVKANDLSDNIVIVEDKLKEKGMGDKVTLFATDEKREGYSLEQWTGDIDKEIKNLRDELNTASPERKKQIFELIEDYEDLKEKKKQELEVVSDENNGNQNENNDVNNTVDENENLTESEDPLEVVDDDYQKDINNIYKTVDESEREDKIRNLNERVLTETNEKIQEYEAILESDPDNEDAKNKRNELLAFKNKVKTNMDEPIVEPQTVDPDNIDKRVDESQFVDNYDEREDKIEAIDDEFDRRAEKNRLNRVISDKVRSEIKQLKNILEDDPDNKDAQKRLDRLMDLDDELNSEIVKNEKWLKNNPKDVDENNMAEVLSVNEDYQNEINIINQIQNEKDRNEAIRDLNDETVTKINNRINEIDKELLNDPENQELLTERDQLTNLKNSINNNPEKAVLEPQTDVEIVENPTSDQLLDNYGQRMNAINTSNEDTKSKEEQKIALNQELINAIEDEIDRLENLKSERPDLSDDIEKSIQNHENLKSEKEDDIAQSQTILDELAETADNNDNNDNNVRNPKNGNGNNDNNENSDVNPELLNMNEVASIDEIYPDYNKNMQDIQQSSDNNISKEQQKIDLNKELISKIEDEIDRLEDLKADNPDFENKIEKRISGLENMKKAKENEIEASENLMDQLASNNGDGNRNTKENLENMNELATVDEIYPDYNQKMANINTSSDNESSKEEQKIDLNKELIDKIDDEIDRLDALKAANPDYKDKIDKRTESLENIKSAKQNEISLSKARIDNLADIDQNEVDGASNETEKELLSMTETASIDEIYPEYHQEMADIQSSGNDDQSKEQQKIKVNEDLIDKVESEIDRLNDLKSSYPDYEDKIDQRIESLENIKKSKEAEIDLSNQLINELASNNNNRNNENTSDIDLQAMNEVASINEIYPDYNQKMADINASDKDESSKEEDKITLNEELIDKIDSEIDQLGDLKSSNPEFEDKIDRRTESLENIKSAKTEEIEASKSRIDNLADIDQNEVDGASDETEKELLSMTETASIDEIYPEYHQEMADIQVSGNDDQSKEQQKIKVNEDLIDKVESEIDRLNDLKSSYPDYEDKIDQRIESLENIKKSKEAEIELSNQLINELASNNNNRSNENTTDIDLQEMSEVASINEVFPEYNQKMTDIESSDASEEDKEQQKIDLNKDLIDRVDSEIDRLNNLKSSNPDFESKIDSRIGSLEDIKSAKEAEIESSNQRINDLVSNNNNRSNDGNDSNNNQELLEMDEVASIDEVYPEYDQKMTDIEASNDSENDKEQQKNDLNKELINKIDNEIDKLNNLKADNPDFENKIDRRVNSLQDIKSTKENEIEASENRVDSLASENTNNGNGTDSNTDNNTENNENNTDNTENENEVNQELLDLNEVPTIDEIMPTYKDEMDNINLSQQSQEEKEQQKIDLNKELIQKIDNEIDRLNDLKQSNPDFSNKIDNRINGLENMKSAKEGEIEKSKQVLDPSTGREDITIEDLYPEYENELENVRSNPDLEVKEKLEKENQLHKQLISAINNKISDLQEEWEEDPSLQEVIDEEISKLEELKEGKRIQIEQNEEKIVALSSTDVADLTEDDYSSQSAKETLKDNEDDIEDIKALDVEIAELEEEKENAESDKDKAKLQKQIDKKKLKKAKVENKVIENLADASDEEFENSKNVVETDAVIASANNLEDAEIADANSDMQKAEQLMKEADQLRKDAANESDDISANEKLKEAIQKENQAKDLVERAGRTFKAARVVDSFSEDEEVIVTDVPDNEEDRVSTQLENKADELEIKANAYSERAESLKDSAETVKKKDREDVLTEADENEQKAAELREEANKVRTKSQEIKEQEDELLANKQSSSNRQPDEETINDLASTDEYKAYHEANESAKENLRKANEIDEEIEVIKKDQKRKIKAAIVKYQDDPDAENKAKNDPDVKSDQEKINDLKQKQQEYKEKAIEDLVAADEALNQAGDKVRDDMVAMADNGVDPQEKLQTPPDSISDYEAPEVVAKDIFRKTDEAVYNDQKQIPIDQKTSGLVYKVQVGAFKNPLPQDYYDQFAPISGQKLDNGITRYMAGYFTKEATANEARDDIRGTGYGDAFVVAYCNGERITIAEAREIEAGRIECEGTVRDESFAMNETENGNDNSTDTEVTDNNLTDNNTTENNTSDNNANENNTSDNNTNENVDNTTDNNTTENNTSNNNVDSGNDVSIKPKNQEEAELASYYTQYEGAAEANQVEIVKGLFYTVQIGVYSRPVRPAVLYDIQPLNSQRLDNGNIRYSTGMFTTVESATVRKEEVVNIGITDAFVTAYFNGERITIAEANEILEGFGESALYNSEENAKANFGDGNVTAVDETTDENETTDTNENIDNTNEVVEEENEFQLSDEDKGPPYRINLGYFEESVPVEFTDLLLNNQDEGILSVSDLNDNVLYFTGSYQSRSGAEDRRDELIAKGFKDAYVVSVVDEEKEDQEEFYPEGVYYRIKLGKFEGEIPGEYATIMLQEQDLIYTEQDIEGHTYLLSNKFNSIEELEPALVEFSELGFEDMEIVSYYKYDAVPMLQAQKIQNGESIGVLQRYDSHEGIDADPYLYHPEAIYFHIEVGRFTNEVPSEFTELLFDNEDENILREETFDDELVFYTENIYDYEKAKQRLKTLKSKGFDNAKIVAFHKYNEISLEKALEILGESENE